MGRRRGPHLLPCSVGFLGAVAALLEPLFENLASRRTASVLNTQGCLWTSLGELKSRERIVDSRWQAGLPLEPTRQGKSVQPQAKSAIFTLQRGEFAPLTTRIRGVSPLSSETCRTSLKEEKEFAAECFPVRLHEPCGGGLGNIPQ